MITQFTKILAENNVNIAEMSNKSKGEVAYTLIDTDCASDRSFASLLEKVDGVFRVRIVK